jgi:NAD(P)H-hydrate repair Nnr-like enzyme with NAD(P)H-hydrate dehydratase domain
MGAPASIATALGISVPEGLALPLPETAAGCVAAHAIGELADLLADADAVLVGPGLFDDEESLQSLVAAVLNGVNDTATVALDGYALRGLRSDTVAPLRGRLVVTPNGGEAAALLADVADAPDPDTDKAAAAEAIAATLGAVVALGGHLADAQGRQWVDESGHAGLGTSGSGDVLAGLVVGLLARGAVPAQAACWATHGGRATRSTHLPRRLPGP